MHRRDGRTHAAAEPAAAAAARAALQGRTPLDLVSAELKPFLCDGGGWRRGEAYAYGAGGNYTLGTGSTDFAPHPARVEGLHGLQPVALAAGKFHSAAITASGQLYTWGWGLGGRLGALRERLVH